MPHQHFRVFQLDEVVDDIRVEAQRRQVDDCVSVVVAPSDECAELHERLKGYKGP